MKHGRYLIFLSGISLTKQSKVVYILNWGLEVLAEAIGSEVIHKALQTAI